MPLNGIHPEKNQIKFGSILSNGFFIMAHHVSSDELEEGEKLHFTSSDVDAGSPPKKRKDTDDYHDDSSFWEENDCSIILRVTVA